MTNLDRIRQMSDEEIFNLLLANFNGLADVFCNKIPAEECRQYDTCAECKIEWLKKEYEGDDNND